ncbi:MAG: redoxin domain-containing protein [Nitrospirae bacterium]|nr:redoxin domain-containing protein [Nitrospirota bacterium]
MMKRMLFVVFSVIVISGCAADKKDVPESKAANESVNETSVNVGGGVGDNAPDFNALSLEGRQVSYYNDLKGKKPVYLTFWATW